MIVGMPFGLQPRATVSCSGSHAASAFLAAGVNDMGPLQSARGAASGSSNDELHTLKIPGVGGCSVVSRDRSSAKAAAFICQRGLVPGAITSSLPDEVNRLVPNIRIGATLEGLPATFTLSPTLSAFGSTLDRPSIPTE